MNGLVLCLDAGNTKGFDKYENLFTYSQEFSLIANGWTPTSVNVTTNNSIAPDGTLTADTVSNTPNVNSYLAQVRSLSLNTTYTVSLHVKVVSGNGIVVFEMGGFGSASFNLSTLSAPSGGTITSLPNSWYRIQYTFTTGSTGTPSFSTIYLGAYGNVATTNTFAIWGAQLERSSAATDYYATTATAKTRASNWIDLSGRGSIGELVNSPTYNSSNLGYLQFVTDDYARIPNDTALDTQTPTVEVWVKTNATTQYGFWFEKGDVNTQYSLFQEGTVIQWRQKFAGGITNLSTTTATYMNTSSWYQVVGTYTSGSRKLYINGILVNSDAQSGAIDVNSGGMSIGALGGYSGGKSYYYNGNLALCRVYNRALTSTEVLQNFNALRGRFGI